jgi:hypothetical protein
MVVSRLVRKWHFLIYFGSKGATAINVIMAISLFGWSRNGQQTSTTHGHWTYHHKKPGYDA